MAENPLEMAIEPLDKRNFWKWFFISIFTFGIGMIIYTYYNFEDLNKMARYPKPDNVPTAETFSGTIAVILTLFTGGIGSIILGYLKFNKLHHYIKNHPQQQDKNIPSGGKYLFFLLGGILIGGLAFAILYVGLTIGLVGPLFLSQGLDPSQYVMIMTIVSFVVGGAIILGFYIKLFVMQIQWQNVYNKRAMILMNER